MQTKRIVKGRRQTGYSTCSTQN